MSDNALEILTHIQNYRLTTAEAVSRVFGVTPGQAVTHLERLRQDGFVDAALLTGEQHYYHLLDRAAEKLRVASVRGGSLTATAKVIAYGTLRFCCLGEKYRPRIPDDVFIEQFSELYRPGPKLNYYTDGATLGFLHVDTSVNTSSHPHRSVQRAYKDIEQRQQPGFVELLEAGRFLVTFVTAHESKVKRLQDEMEHLRERHELYCRFLQFKADGVDKMPSNATWRAAAAAYRHWHKSDKKRGETRKPPRLPPPMAITAIPELLDVMHPKPLAE